jgi:YidC/Oxa1 family membrane protein insertase
MLNGLVLLYGVLFQNFGLAIIVFTIIMRLLMFPLSWKQAMASKGMAALQPKMQALQRRYGKDRQKLTQETQRLYKEQGVNPLGCALPTLMQFPIWIGLYQSILQAMAARPENLLSLSQHLYNFLPQVQESIPLGSSFLWLNLAEPDRTFILPILVGVSTWVQQKMTTMPTADPQQQATNQMMTTMMPFMFAFFTLQFASGLAIYWAVSNIFSMVLQYFVTGWGSLIPRRATAALPKEASAEGDSSADQSSATADAASPNPSPKGRRKTRNGRVGGKRKVS